MIKIPVSIERFESANIFTVRIGTNCPAGGDSGHGGRTVFSIRNDASTDMRASIDGAPSIQVQSVELIFGGDTECETFILALEHCVKVLKAQSLVNCITEATQIVE